MTTGSLPQALQAEEGVPCIVCLRGTQYDMHLTHLGEVVIVLDSADTLTCHLQDSLTAEHVSIHLSEERDDLMLLQLVVHDGDLLPRLVLELCPLQGVPDNDGQRLSQCLP